MIDNPKHPLDRIRRPEAIDELLQWAATACGIGPVQDYRVSDMGYDDCNIVLITASGRYLAKILTTARPRWASERYVQLLATVVAHGILHPRLLTAPGGQVLLRHSATGNLLVVMEYVDGATFLELSAYPDDNELDIIIDQVHRVHAVDTAPRHIEDWWAVPNIAALVAEVSPMLDPQDRELVLAAAGRFAEVDLAALPHTLVHGDLTKANVLRRSDGGLAIIDFAVANRYPRVHELAMIIVNLLHGHPSTYPERIGLIAERYGRRCPLTAPEWWALPRYVFACAAMELLGATRESVLKGNDSAETQYLLALGRTATREAAW